MSVNQARAYIEILGKNGFRRLFAPRLGAVVVMQPTFFSNPQAYQAGHLGIIVTMTDQSDTWDIALRQAGLTQRFGKIDSHCSNVKDVDWKPYPKSWDNLSISYWLPPDTNGATIDPSRTYIMTNVNSGKVLNVLENNTKDGAEVTQWDKNGGENQEIKFEPANVGDGRNWYNIKFVFSGKYLVVNPASRELGAQALQWGDNKGDYAKWLLISLGDGKYQLQNRNSGQMLAIADSNMANNAALVQWPWQDQTDQQWTVQISHKMIEK
jgi:hypothetical protein